MEAVELVWRCITMSESHSALDEKAFALFGERALRAETNWIAVIRTSEGIEIPCTVKDVSKSGARIGVPASYYLPDSFLLKIIGKDFICRVALAWRKGHFAGVRIEQFGKIAPKSAPSSDGRNSADATDSTQHKAIGSHRSRISAF